MNERVPTWSTWHEMAAVVHRATGSEKDGIDRSQPVSKSDRAINDEAIATAGRKGTSNG
jgi:hypothetical protein